MVNGDTMYVSPGVQKTKGTLCLWGRLFQTSRLSSVTKRVGRPRADRYEARQAHPGEAC